MRLAHYLTVDEVAERCRVAPATVRGWILRKLLRKHKAHGRVLIDEADLDAFIKPDGSFPEPTEAVS